MKRLLEIVTEIDSPVVCAAQDHQRERLREEYMHTLLDFRGMSTQDRARALDLAPVPDGVLLRGISDYYGIGRAFPRAPIVVDHCTNAHISQAAKGSYLLAKMTVLCYSPKAAALVRDAGARRVIRLPGPYLRDLREEVPRQKTIRVGFMPGPYTVAALKDALRVAKEKSWAVFEFFTCEHRLIGVQQVEDVFELANICDVLVQPLETEDLGGPNDAAILCAAYGCSLASVATDSLEPMGFFAGSYALVQKYSRGGYGGALALFLEHRERYETGVRELQYDADRFFDVLRSSLG